MKKKLLIAGGLFSLLNNNYIKKKKKRNTSDNVDYFDEKTDINHLVMSGGGLGGTQYVYFLSELEKKYDLTKNILNYVDMISSNSIGSIVTFGYLLGYSSEELKEIIDEICLKIFKKNTLIIPFETTLKLTGGLGSFYDNEALKELLKKFLKESPLNKNIKSYNIGLDELTYENFTLDVLKKIYPQKIFNFITFNLNKSRIEIFTNTDVYDRIEEDIKKLKFKIKGIDPDISNIIKANSSISYNDCFVKSSRSKVLDVIMASSAVPFFFESIEIESLCEGKPEKNYYADGLIAGGNIPVLLGNKLLELIISKNKNNEEYNINNMIIEVKSEVNEKYKPKNGLSSLFEFLGLVISSGTGFYTKILSYDQLSEKIRFNNRYFGVKYEGFILSYKQFEKNKDKYLKDKENYFNNIINFEFPQRYKDGASFDYFRYLSSDKWLSIFIKNKFRDEEIKNEEIINKLKEGQKSSEETQFINKINESTLEDLVNFKEDDSGDELNENKEDDSGDKLNENKEDDGTNKEDNKKTINLEDILPDDSFNPE